MEYVRSFFYQFKNAYTDDDRLVTLIFAVIFLPWPITCVMTIAISIYILRKKDFKRIYKKVKKSSVLLVFVAYLMLTTIIHQNWLPLLSVIAVGLMAVNVIYYREYIHKMTFERNLDIALIISFFAFIYSLFEQATYSFASGLSFFYIQNEPDVRVHSFYANANYYAYIILILLAMAVYKFLKAKGIRWKSYYAFYCVINLFCLYLTGSRVCWPAIASGVIMMLVVAHWYKTSLAALGFAGACCAYIAKNPSILPRLTTEGLSLGRRVHIWRTALMMVRDHWLFGLGAMGYYSHYAEYIDEYIATYGWEEYNEYSTLHISSVHAHSIFLEPIISFGLVGTLIIIVYLLYEAYCAILLWRRKIDLSLAALIIATFAMTFVFCIVDFPLWWVQTGYLFFLMIGSSDIYRKELGKKK